MNKFIQRVLDAAKAHGEQSDPDHEVGDLQELVRDMWTLLTPKQRDRLAPNWDEFIKDWLR